ncbi:MAG: ABC transporter substrate-binding protein [Thermoanaerobaculia bacterium]
MSTAIAPPVTRKAFRVGITSPPRTLDPHAASDTISALVINQIFQTPYVFHSRPDVAEPLLFSEPLREEAGLERYTCWSASIRNDVHFSDGTPLTAELAARALNRASGNDGSARFEAKGDRVWIRLREPNARYAWILAQTNYGIALQKGSALLGTGAFMLDPADGMNGRKETMRLVANPFHAGQLPFEEIEFRVFPAGSDGSPSALIEAIRGGDVDFTNALQMEEVTRNRLPMVPTLHPGDSTGFLFFNTESAAFSNRMVRKAIAHALVVEKIAEQTFDRNPVAFVASGYLPPIMGKHRGTIRQDPVATQAIFNTKGVTRPTRVSLLIPWGPRPYLPKPLPVGREIARQLGAIGIAVDLKIPQTPGEFFDSLVRGDWDLALAGWVADNPDPVEYLCALLSSSNVPTTEFRPNVARFRNDAVDAALRTFRLDPSEPVLRSIIDLLLEEVPLIPLIDAPNVTVRSRRVHGSPIPVTGIPTFAEFDCAA